ncbi:MAG: hypothetical protein H0V34_09940 [Gammaproteobacteria bacterium]|nr:hypothetical protein [Gammaproteobacteria bacterium]
MSAAGFSEAQAEALISALSRDHEDSVTKADLRDMATKGDLKELEIRFIKWMVGLVIPLYAIQIAVFLALLF